MHGNPPAKFTSARPTTDSLFGTSDHRKLTLMFRVAFILFIIMLLTYIFGCQSMPKTPKGKLALIKETYTKTMENLTLARRAGKIDDDLYLVIDAVATDVYDAINIADQALLSGDADADRWIEVANQMLATLIEHRIQVESNHEDHRSTVDRENHH